MPRKTARKRSYKRSTRKQYGGRGVRHPWNSNQMSDATREILKRENIEEYEKMKQQEEREAYKVWLQSPAGQKEIALRKKAIDDQQKEKEINDTFERITLQYKRASNILYDIINTRNNSNKLVNRRRMYSQDNYNTLSNKNEKERTNKEALSRENALWIKMLQDLKESTIPRIKEKLPEFEAELYASQIKMIGVALSDAKKKKNKPTYLEDLWKESMNRIPTDNPIFMEQLPILKRTAIQYEIDTYDEQIQRLERLVAQLKSNSQMSTESLKKQIQEAEQGLSTERAELSHLLSSLKADPEMNLYLDKLTRNINKLNTQSANAKYKGDYSTKMKINSASFNKKQLLEYLTKELKGTSVGGFWLFGPSDEEIAKQKKEKDDLDKKEKDDKMSQTLDKITTSLDKITKDEKNINILKSNLHRATTASSYIPRYEKELTNVQQAKDNLLTTI